MSLAKEVVDKSKADRKREKDRVENGQNNEKEKKNEQDVERERENDVVDNIHRVHEREEATMREADKKAKPMQRRKQCKEGERERPTPAAGMRGGQSSTLQAIN